MSKRILSLFLACVMLVLAVPVLALPAFAEETDIFTESFDQETDITVTENARATPGTIQHLYVWYKADGTAKKINNNADPLEDTDYAVYNPVLIERGIISADDDYNTVLEKYYDYLLNAARFTYAGNWAIGSYQADGSYAKTEQRVFTYNQWWYGARIAGGGTSPHVPVATNSWEVQFGTSLENATKYLDSYIALGADAVHPGEDGKIFFSEIAEIYSNQATANKIVRNADYQWDKHAGAASFQKNKPGSEVKLIALRPTSAKTNKACAAYNYVVPAGVVGTARLAILGFADYQAAPAKFAIALNGEVVWPAGAVMGDATDWWSYAGDGNIKGFTDALADFSIDVVAGDNLAICVSRDVAQGDSGPILDMQPEISIERKYVVEFQDADGENLTSHVVAKNAPMPKAPFAAAAEGWLINDQAAAELPETVTDNLTVVYVGEPTIVVPEVKQVDIQAGTDFGIGVYFDVDPYAKRAGIATDDGDEYWGELQADGSYKVSMPGFAAKEMDNELGLWIFQEFENAQTRGDDGYYALIPTEELASYADRDVSAAEKAVAAAALDYIAAAKAYFAGEALDAEVAARLAAQDAAIAALESEVELADGEEYAINGMVLVLKDQVYFKVRVASSMYDPMGAETLDFVVAVEGKGTETEYSGFVYTEGGEEYDITMTLGAVAANDYDQTFKFTVKDGSIAVSEVFEYSVNDYIARTFDASADEANLLRAIYALGVAAENA